MNTIRTAAQRSRNFNWLNYDIQFRLKCFRNHTVDWGIIDVELWLLYVAQGSFLTSPQMSNFSNKSAKCFEFHIQRLYLYYKANTYICQNLMGSFDIICKELRVPLSEEKTEGPSTYITFLGLCINTINQTIFIPKDKVDTLKSMIHNVYTRRKVTLKVMQ